MANINNIKANFALGGARPNQFRVFITNPIVGLADINFQFMVKAAQIPGHDIGRIDISYMGRKYPIPGDRNVSDWTTTIMNDETFDIRNGIETWMNAINSQQGNIATNGAAPANYMSQATVEQLSKSGQVIRVYEMHNIWPMSLSPIDLNWEANDQIEEFQVTWAMSDFEVIGGQTGNAGGI